jgi:hypothetical protein
VSGITKTLTFAALLTSAALGVSPMVYAGGPAALSDSELDRVTAGDVNVFGNATSQATGTFVIANSGSNSIVGSTNGVEDGFGSSGGIGTGTAVAHTNGANGGTSNTTVNTGGNAAGNFTLSIAGGGTATAAGTTIQSGFTASYGVFIPGL